LAIGVFVAVFVPGASASAHPKCKDDYQSIMKPQASKFVWGTLRSANHKRHYDAAVLTPVAHGTGKLPGVLVLHGGGDACRLWWVARMLAGKGYVDHPARR
jgi:hypothetical protein